MAALSHLPQSTDFLARNYVEPSEPDYLDGLPTPPMLRRWAEELNEDLFDGKLPLGDMTFKYNNRKAAYGVCKTKSHSFGARQSFTIELSKKLLKTGRGIRKTFVHELCHAYAITWHNSRGHDKYFWDIMNKVGYPDGHCFENMLGCETDRYSTGDHDLKVGDIVEFPMNVQTGRHQYMSWIVRGRVARVNKRTVSVSQMVQICDTEKPTSLISSGIKSARVGLTNVAKLDGKHVEEYRVLRDLGTLPPIQFDQIENEEDTVDNSDLGKLRRLRNLSK